MQITVDLSRLRHNIRIIRSLTRNKFCAVVKAQAYGHGAAVAKYIEPLSDCFLTATHDEAVELVCLGIQKPILVLGGELSPFLRDRTPNIIPTALNYAQVLALMRSGVKNFSVAVNTGMNRLGANESELKRIVGLCKQNDIAPYSVYSHIYNGISSAMEQSELFDRLTADAVLQRNRHLYCSCALDLGGSAYLYDMTRCGIAAYGYAKELEPCLRARAKIVAVAYVAKGSNVGYGGYILDRNAVIATVRCGYADGLRRCDKQLFLSVRGVKCPIVGVPCMDLTMIDVTNAPCRVGEYAYLIDGKEDTEYLARCYGTIVYEVLTGLNGRAERIYI